MTTTQTPPTRYSIRHPRWNADDLADENVRQVADSLVATYGGEAAIYIDDEYLVETHFTVPGVPAAYLVEADNDQSARLHVTLPSGGRPVEFSLDLRTESYGGRPQEPTVNWSALGARPAADTRAFAAALTFCADLLALHQAKDAS